VNWTDLYGFFKI